MEQKPLPINKLANSCWFRFLSSLRYLNFWANVPNSISCSIIVLILNFITENNVAKVALLYTLHMLNLWPHIIHLKNLERFQG